VVSQKFVLEMSCHPEHPDSRGELRRGMNAWRSALCWFCCGSWK
jgi:hypothetical protein